MNRRLRKRIWICGDVWMDILPSFDHAKLGLKMALLSDRFDVLVDKHFDGKSELTIWKPIRIQQGKGPKSKLFVRVDDQFVAFPFPDRPLPNKICFKDLQIDYIDRTVRAFLRSNKQIWDRIGTNLELAVSWNTDDKHPIWEVFARQIWPIFAANIRHLNVGGGQHLDNLRRHISPTLLTDLNHLNSIQSGCLFPDAFGDFDGPNPTFSAGQALSKWLHSPTKNGQPKRLRCYYYFCPTNLECVKSLKEKFISATASVSYKISVKMPMASIERFNEWVNERTQEKLTSHIAGYWWLLKRCPISENAATDQWKNDENWENNLNNVKFNLRGSTRPFCPKRKKKNKKKKMMKRAKALKRRRSARK